MSEITIQSLLASGAHFGHMRRKWNPRMKPFIFSEKNGVHVIDLEQTIARLDTALKMVRDIVSGGGKVLFLCTKKNMRTVVMQAAEECGSYFIVERWLGGALTNFNTIRQSINRLKELDKESLKYTITKKERIMREREREKLHKLHSGIIEMRRLPDVIIVADIEFNDIAVNEAKTLGIPVVGIVDTNTDPTVIDYPIPANDDSIRTVQLIMNSFSQMIQQSAKGQ
ncbi:30S ribosomal protein S2 [bacterium]|nr:30S ribosomal protein S2 [bacterium]